MTDFFPLNVSSNLTKLLTNSHYNAIYNSFFAKFLSALIILSVLFEYHLNISISILLTTVPYCIIFLDQIVLILYTNSNRIIVLIVVLTILMVFLIHILNITNIIQSFGCGFIRYSNVNSNINSDKIVSDTFINYVYNLHSNTKIYFILSMVIYLISLKHKYISDKILRGELVAYLIINVLLRKYKNGVLNIVVIVGSYLIVGLLKKKESECEVEFLDGKEDQNVETVEVIKVEEVAEVIKVEGKCECCTRRKCMEI